MGDSQRTNNGWENRLRKDEPRRENIHNHESCPSEKLGSCEMLSLSPNAMQFANKKKAGQILILHCIVVKKMVVRVPQSITVSIVGTSW